MDHCYCHIYDNLMFWFHFTAHSNAKSDQVVRREICAVITKGMDTAFYYLLVQYCLQTVRPKKKIRECFVRTYIIKTTKEQQKKLT